MARLKNITVLKDSLMSKLYLHIGAHKTGTTSFQYSFDSKKEDFLESEGVLYPDSCRFHYAHHRLAFAMKRMRDPAKGDVPDLSSEFNELKREVLRVRGERDVNSVVVSSEEFFTAPSEEIVRFIEKARGLFDSIEIVAAVRRYDNQFVSIYNQKVKTLNNGFFRPIDFFVKKPHLLDDELFFGKHLSAWNSALGANCEMKVFLYEEHDDISDSLIGYVSSGKLYFEKSARINESVPIKYLEFVRHLKALLGEVEDIRSLAEKAYEFFEKDEDESLLSYEERCYILSFFEDDKSTLSELLGRPVPYEIEKLFSKGGPVKKRLTVNDTFSFFLELYGMREK